MSIVGSDLMRALTQHVAFDGLTGAISFHDGTAHPTKLYHGDRREGNSYAVSNFRSGAAGNLVSATIGHWTPCPSSFCEWSQQWAPATHENATTHGNATMVFAGGVEAPPSSSALPLCRSFDTVYVSVFSEGSFTPVSVQRLEPRHCTGASSATPKDQQLSGVGAQLLEGNKTLLTARLGETLTFDFVLTYANERHVAASSTALTLGSGALSVAVPSEEVTRLGQHTIVEAKNVPYLGRLAIALSFVDAHGQSYGLDAIAHAVVSCHGVQQVPKAGVPHQCECAAGYTAATLGTDLAPCVRTPSGDRTQDRTVTCSAEYVWVQPRIALAACKQGTYKEHGGNDACTLCPMGSYEASDGSIECKRCPRAHFSSSLGAVSCDVCRPGTATSYEGAKQCDVCVRRATSVRCPHTKPMETRAHNQTADLQLT
eukprot:4816577-Prymnesium_polylepis.1